MITMPVNGEFKFMCLHCKVTGKQPMKMKDETQDYKLHFCSQCKKSTLIRYSGDVCTLFKVEE